MSSARSGRGDGSDPDAGIRDGRNLLVVPIIKVAKELLPRVIVVENVPAFLTRQVRHPSTHRPISAAELLISELGDEYAAFAATLDLAEYGIPQHRRRSFLTLVHKDERALQLMFERGVCPFPRPTHGTSGRPMVTIDRALASMNLPPLDASCDSSASDSDRPMHCVPVWDETRYAMVEAIPGRSGAGAWENNVCAACGTVEVNADDATCPSCQWPLLRPVMKDKSGRWRLIHGFRSSSYRRMPVNQPASTVTTASGHVGSDLTIHPWENRVLSPLECADLQTIPRRFKWGQTLEKFGTTFLRDMIGEAVPPRFTERHGEIIHKLLTGNVDRSFLPACDDRCMRAARRLKVNVNGLAGKRSAHSLNNSARRHARA